MKKAFADGEFEEGGVDMHSCAVEVVEFACLVVELCGCGREFVDQLAAEFPQVGGPVEGGVCYCDGPLLGGFDKGGECGAPESMLAAAGEVGPA